MNKEIKDTKRGKDLFVHGLARINVVRISTIMRVICRFDIIPLKVHEILFRYRKTILKFYNEAHTKHHT